MIQNNKNLVIAKNRSFWEVVQFLGILNFKIQYFLLVIVILKSMILFPYFKLQDLEVKLAQEKLEVL